MTKRIYEPGQVWTVRGRPQDEAPLLKIQMVEGHDGPDGEDVVYHCSIIGLTFANPEVKPEIPHAPLSRRTLDDSLIQQTATEDVFPDPAEGVHAWREGEGGVFTVSVAELAQMYDDVTADFAPAGDNLYFRTDWSHARADDPVWALYEVDPEGRVLRTIHAFADGGGLLTGVEDFADNPDDLPEPGSLVRGSFYETWKDVPFNEPFGDDGDQVVLNECPRAEFEALWNGNRD